MQDRYFVKVVSRDPGSFSRLSRLGLDLFHPTAQRSDDGNGRHVIDGLMALDQVGRLVDEGYEVTVVDAAPARRSTNIETNTFEEWLAGMTGNAVSSD